MFAVLGRAGLLSLPYPEEYGGGGQPYEVYLQVLEEIAAAWAAVGVGVSVHSLSCFGLFHAGTEEQKRRWLPEMLGGELLGAYCLSEAHAGSDPAAIPVHDYLADLLVVAGQPAGASIGQFRPGYRAASEELTPFRYAAIIDGHCDPFLARWFREREVSAAMLTYRRGWQVPRAPRRLSA